MMNKKNKRIVETTMLGGFVLGLILALFLFTLVFNVFYEQVHAPNRFALIHQQYPALYFIYLLPFIITIIARQLALRYVNSIDYLKQKVEEKDDIITKNALFAKSIGEGDFDTVLMDDLNNKDLLSKSLIIMRKNLINARRKEEFERWVTEGREMVSDILRRHQTLDKLPFELLKALIEYSGLIQGSFFLYDEDSHELQVAATYAYRRRKYPKMRFKIGEGLIGEAAYEQLPIYRTEIPEEYATITSGLLGDKKPGSLFIMPLLSEDHLQGVIEVAHVADHIDEKVRSLIEMSGPAIGQMIFNLNVNIKTAMLLEEARMLTEELRENEEELQQNAEEMRMTHEELEKTNRELERQIKAVEASKTKMYALLENASEVISIYDREGKIIYESPSTSRIFGYNYQDVIGMQGLKRVAPEFVELVKENFKTLLDNPYKTVTYSFKHLKADGSSIWVETHGQNMLNNEAIGGIIFNTRDITLQRRGERDRRLKSQMQSLSENSPDLILRLGKKGKIHYYNPVTGSLMNAGKKRMEGQYLQEVEMNQVLKEDILLYFDKALKSGHIAEGEVKVPFLNRDIFLNLTAIPEYNEDKELDSILIVGHDVSDIKIIEQEIKEKNVKLTESINYAKRIQSSILPNYALLRSNFSDAFIFYKPRDVVSGDFPWFKAVGDTVFVAAVDCTGHGVPGALLSFIGYFLLNDIVNVHHDKSAAEILHIFDKEVQGTLRQNNGGSQSRDGMDIALCKFSGTELDYAGAHRPLLFLRGDELQVFKGDRRSIGGFYARRAPQKDFTSHRLTLESGDRLFIFSDGLPDQFSKHSKEKYSARRIRQKVVELSKRSLTDNYSFFIDDFEAWKQDYRQIDDVLMIGIEI